MKDITENIRKLCERHFSKSSISHDWDHSKRVYRLAMHIGTTEGADMDVLAIASYLHDIGRIHQDNAKGKICHAEKSAEMAEEILNEFPITEERKKNILHCIICHRYRNNHIPQTIEAKVLFDSDKLDAIGAVGIARAYLFAGEVGAKLHNENENIENTSAYSREDTGYREYRVKLSKLKDAMLTDEGKRLAQGRHAFMEEYFKRFRSEINGEI